jgi:hypothetical protein
VHSAGAPDHQTHRQVGQPPSPVSSLKVLNSTGDFETLSIDYAPNLERFVGSYMNQRKVHIKVMHAPKLEYLGRLGMSNKIEVGDTSFEVSLLIEQSEIDYGNCLL